MDGVSKNLVHPDVRKKISDLLDSKGISDYNIEVTSGSKKGDNYVGVIAKLTIEGKDKEENPVKFEWIVKSAPQQDIYRNMLKVDQIYEREVMIYEKVLPQFRQFETKKGIANFILETPECVMSCLEPYRESFVMQDMKALGYAMWNRKQPMNLNHVRLVMRAYGKLHAISFAMRDQNPQVFEQMSRDSEENIFKATDRDEMTKNLETHHEKIIEYLDSVKDAKVIEVYKRYSERSVYIVLDAMLLAENDPLAVIGHGDCWINNMLFKYDDIAHPNYPTKICLLDWQLARYGSLAFDLSYFFYTSTDKELRDKHYDMLIKVYYFSLCGHLTELGSNPEVLIPFEMVQEQMKRYSIYGLYMATIVLRAVMSEEEEVPEIKDGMSQQELLGTLAVKHKNQEAYQERMRGIVVDFYEKGYFDFYL